MINMHFRREYSLPRSLLSNWTKSLPLFMCFIFCFDSILLSQDIKDYNRALIWRGMEHKWTYNHRANRLGNYVTMNNGGHAIHTSATGLGNDSTTFTSHYTYVESPDIVFKEVSVTIRLNGEEGALLTKVEDIYVSVDEWLRNKAAYHAIINGFEIKSLLKADQLELFRFLVDDVEYSRESNEIKLRTHFNLSTNCRTIECPVFSNKTAYELTLHILIIAFDNDDANIVNTYSARNYVWDEKIEIEERTQRVIALGQKNNVYPKVAIGIKGLGIILDEEHWLLEMNEYVVPHSYDSETGILICDTNLKYVEWKKGMQQFAVAPFKAKFAKRRNGYALLDMNLAMLQFKNALIKHGKSTDTMFWKGWNKDASSKESKGVVNLSSFINGSK